MKHYNIKMLLHFSLAVFERFVRRDEQILVSKRFGVLCHSTEEHIPNWWTASVIIGLISRTDFGAGFYFYRFLFMEIMIICYNAVATLIWSCSALTENSFRHLFSKQNSLLQNSLNVNDRVPDLLESLDDVGSQNARCTNTIYYVTVNWMLEINMHVHATRKQFQFVFFMYVYLADSERWDLSPPKTTTNMNNLTLNSTTHTHTPFRCILFDFLFSGRKNRHETKMLFKYMFCDDFFSMCRWARHQIVNMKNQKSKTRKTYNVSRTCEPKLYLSKQIFHFI